jgi:hypothetical protein
MSSLLLVPFCLSSFFVVTVTNIYTKNIGGVLKIQVTDSLLTYQERGLHLGVSPQSDKIQPTNIQKVQSRTSCDTALTTMTSLVAHMLVTYNHYGFH